MNFKEIASIELFKGCKIVRKESEGVEILELERGEFLRSKHFQRNGIGIMLSGTARIMRKTRQGAMLMSKLKSGDAFGAATILSEDSTFAPEIICMSRCKVLLIAEREWLEWLHDDAVLMNNYLRYLNGRLRFLNLRLNALSQNSVEDRIMTYLENAATDGIYMLDSYTELAMMMCVGRASLYRVLDSLEAAGKLKREGKAIILQTDRA